MYVCMYVHKRMYAGRCVREQIYLDMQSVHAFYVCNAHVLKRLCNVCMCADTQYQNTLPKAHAAHILSVYIHKINTYMHTCIFSPRARSLKIGAYLHTCTHTHRHASTLSPRACSPKLFLYRGEEPPDSMPPSSSLSLSLSRSFAPAHELPRLEGQNEGVSPPCMHTS
jgi:hypothetical protein